MTHRGGLWGLVVGLASLGIGVAAVVSAVVALAVVAGVASAIAAGFSVRASRRLRRAEHRIAGLTDQVSQLNEARSPSGGLSPTGGILTSASMRHPDDDALIDPATGLFSEGYFHVALDARISSARRYLRPASIVMLEVVRGLASGNPFPEEPATVAKGIKMTLREADTACRMADGRFALVLEDTPENGAIWTVERVRRHLADEASDQTLWAGVASYPAHGFDPEELIAQSLVALAAAKEWRQDRIEVAVAS